MKLKYVVLCYSVSKDVGTIYINSCLVNMKYHKIKELSSGCFFAGIRLQVLGNIVTSHDKGLPE